MPNLQPIDLIRHVKRMLSDATAGRLPESDAIKLCEFAAPFCGESFTEVRWLNGAVGMMLKHPAATGFRNVRALDFAAVTLMCLPGGCINHVPSGNAPYSYLRYEHPDDISPGKRVRLNRIITNAPGDRSVAFVKGYHDYFRENFKMTRPRVSEEADPELGRDEAIALARKLYEANPQPTLAYLSADGFEALLREVFAVADVVHGCPQATEV